MYTLLKDGVVVVEGSKYDIADYFGYNIKPPRNIEQNKKYWKLLNLLAKKMQRSIEELHFELLKDFSVRYEVLVPEGVDLRGIEYKEKKSKINKDGKDFVVWWVFTPSHELKTDEFAVLLEGLCNECEQQGIPTLMED